MALKPMNTEPVGPDFAQSILDYLRLRTSNSAIEFAQTPKPMIGGFDAAIFQFRLENVGTALAGPLVLRLLQSARSAQQAVREAAIQTAIASLGYPAPDVKFTETDCGFLGGAFLIMEHLPGRPLASEFERLLRERRSIFSLWPALHQLSQETRTIWDAAQSQLHVLDASQFLALLEAAGLNRADFLFDAALAHLRTVITDAGAEGLAPAVKWLDANRPDESRPAVICHGDLQPLNILAEDGKLTGVLDWGGAVVAHPALDYGAAVAIFATLPIPAPWPVRPFVRRAMNRLARNHTRDYLQRDRRGKKALRFFTAYNCFSQLTWVAWRRANGLPPTGIYDSAVGVRNLIAQFRACTGVGLGILLSTRS